MSESTTYRVVWSTWGSEKRFVSHVVIIPGYTTTDDVPKIIATRRTGRPDDAVFITVHTMTQEG